MKKVQILSSTHSNSFTWEGVSWHHTFDVDSFQFIYFPIPENWQEIFRDPGKRVQMLNDCIHGMYPMDPDIDLDVKAKSQLPFVSIDAETAFKIEELDYESIQSIKMSWGGSRNEWDSDCPVSICYMEMSTGKVEQIHDVIHLELRSPLDLDYDIF